MYRHLFNPALYLTAYGKLYSNQGALTPGTTTETVDGMSEAKILAVIESVRYERYRWSPARRVYIEKKNSAKKRPLGMPTWSDKLLQEVIRMILDAYFEPQFSDHSHGFRPNRGCGTAIEEVYRSWRGTAWFIEGDIASYFDTIDHSALVAILRTTIHDNRFLRLIENMLTAGYLEDWKFDATLSGTPQGGVASPILANIYLDMLDQYVEQYLMPMYNRGATRESNKEYRTLSSRMVAARKRGDDRKLVSKMAREVKRLPTQNPTDPNYRRLKYVRYADDFLLGFVGPKAEAEEIKQRIGGFLRDTLKLDLSEEKTLLTHASTAAARFLGYAISINRDNTRRGVGGNRTLGGQVTLRVPEGKVAEACKPYMAYGKPTHRTERMDDDAFSIISQYQAEYRGIVEYYRKAINLRDFTKLKWVMEQSLTKTLATKLKISVAQVYRRYVTTLDTPHGRTKVLRVMVPREGKKPLIATWGGIRLTRVTRGWIEDKPGKVWNTKRTELVERLLAETCERCGSTDRVEVHHVRALKDLQARGQKPRPDWLVTMASCQRKTLVVCFHCHHNVIHGRGDTARS